MSRTNPIREKSFAFGVQIIGIAQTLRDAHQFELASQLIRSGTSIGANVEEACSAQSKRDFAHKLAISVKESRETHYWLRLLIATKLADRSKLELLKTDCEELTRILNSILLTLETRYELKIKETDEEYAAHSEFRIQNSEFQNPLFEQASGQ